jgi:hypothetical protein
MDGTTLASGADVATDETANLISSDKVVGTSVYNRQGETLGSVYALMLNKLNGRVAYAVMSFGGFLGIGESYHPLPWRVLSYDTGLNGYVVDIDRNRLENAPHYNSAVDAESLRERDRIDAYYAIPPA